MAMSRTMGPFGRGTAMTSGLLPMVGRGRSPGGKVGEGVGPADAEEA